jgi:hypothetical protein
MTMWLPVRPALSVAALVGLCVPALVAAQSAARRLTTIDSSPALSRVLPPAERPASRRVLAGGRRIFLKADENELTVQLVEGVTTQTGAVEVRGQIIDVGRLEPGRPRVGPLGGP